MSIKRTTVTALAAAVSLTVLAGCSGTSQGGGEESKGALAMSFPVLSQVQIWQDTLTEMKPIIEDAGYEFLSDDPGDSVQTQMSDWQAWVTRGDVKAIMGWATQADAAVPVTAEATSAGVPVIAYANTWDGVSATLLLDAYADGYSASKGAAQAIIDSKGADAEVSVALLTDRASDTTAQRADGLVAGIEENLPNATVYELTATTRDIAYNAATAQLAAHPDTTVWVASQTDAGLGAYQAVIDSGVAEDDANLVFGTLDATDEVLDLFEQKNSAWKSVWILPAREIAAAAAGMLIAAAEGDKLTDQTVESVQVTAANAESFRLG